jgi:hypothetical protein
MAAVAEIGILLDIGIIADGEDDPENADDEEDRDQNDLVTRAQPTIKPVETIFKKFDHAGRKDSVARL